MARSGRVERAAAFVLHAYPYSETSLLIEAFTRSHGRMPWVAKGARRAGSGLRGMLLAFQPLQASWSGRGDVRTLTRCEWLGGQPFLKGQGLLCGFYMNELLLRLLPREDPHEQLFDRYAAAVNEFAARHDPGPILRRFERALLQEVGYALVLDREGDTGKPIEAGALYRYDLERGPLRVVNGASPDAPLLVPGGALLAISRDDYSDAATAQHA